MGKADLPEPRLLGGEFLDRDVLELDRCPVAAEADVTAPTLGSLVLGFLLVQFVKIGVEYNGSVQFDLHERSVDGDFLMVPFTNRLEVTALGRLQSVKGTMILVIF